MKAAFDGLATYVYSLLCDLTCVGMFVLVVVHNSHVLRWGEQSVLGGGEEVSAWWSATLPRSLAHAGSRWGAAALRQSVRRGLVCACLCSEGVWAPLLGVD